MFDLETSVLTHFESDFDPEFQVTQSRLVTHEFPNFEFRRAGSNPDVIIFLVFNQVIKSWASTNMIWDK